MAQREQVFVGQPQTFGGARLLPSPSQFFLTGEDRLRVVSVNSLAGVSLKVQWRTATAAGDVVPNSQPHTPNSDRTIKQQDYELGSGSLLNVTVFAGAGAPVIGQTYVMVQIVRGEGLAAIVLGTILAGYVTAVQALGFPGSPIVSSVEGEPYLRAISGTAPALGVAITETVPAGARWELLAWYFAFTTSATVVDRKPYLVPASGGVSYGVMTNFSTVPASTANQFTFGPTLASTSDPINGVYQAGWGTRVLLTAGGTLTASAFALQPGDRFSAPQYTVREWLEVS
jgi:hypothetical protein